jgi:hypothetical protein
VKKEEKWFLGYLLLYFALNVAFLCDFPFAHSDEAWLSGLTRNMMETKSLAVTEPFFDLKPRYPHAIKSLFHLLQMSFLRLFGYSLFSFRLLSLLSAVGCLWLFYRLALRLTGNRMLGGFCGVLLSLDIQFLYAAHFARQEILILLCMLGVYWLLLYGGKYRCFWAALLTGLSVGLHPNSFLVATLGGGVLCAKWWQEKKLRWREFGVYTGVTGTLALGFVLLSLRFDPDFFAHYAAYGSEFSVDASLVRKVMETAPYFQRLFYRVSGTYYTPDIRLQLLLFLSVLLVGLVILIGSRGKTSLLYPLAALGGIWAGMMLVGRYSQPYVIFLFPFEYLGVAWLLGSLKGRLSVLGMAALVVMVACSAGWQLYPVLTQQRGSYARYLEEIAKVVPPDAKTVGNLNSEYYFENGALLDYRNLSYLKDKGMSLEEYLEKSEVQYLVISDELHYLYSMRPVWNGIYGNLSYLKELGEVLARCQLLYEFTDNLYGVRVVRFQNTQRDFAVRIYRYSPQ